MRSSQGMEWVSRPMHPYGGHREPGKAAEGTAEDKRYSTSGIGSGDNGFSLPGAGTVTHTMKNI